MSTFIDSSVWFSAANRRDRHNQRAKAILAAVTDPITTDHVLVETWLLLNSRIHRNAAEQFWRGVREGAVEVENVTAADLESAWLIGTVFQDQHFSLVDRTSFAFMERTGIAEAASFDSHFAVYRYGRARNKAFEVIR